MMNETNDVFTMEDEPIASVMQDMRKGSKWLSAFLESYRPPLDGERYLTDGEVAELLRVSRRTLQEYRNNRVLPFILLGGKVLYPNGAARGAGSELPQAAGVRRLHEKVNGRHLLWCCPFTCLMGNLFLTVPDLSVLNEHHVCLPVIF